MTPFRIISTAVLILSLAGISGPIYAQHEPFVVHETRPVITQGPYLVDPGETSVTIVWMTDTPAHSKVVYGPENGGLAFEVEPVKHGLIPVGTLHTVRLTGLEPGRNYQYRVISTRVVKLKAYWPEKGLSVECRTRTRKNPRLR